MSKKESTVDTAIPQEESGTTERLFGEKEGVAEPVIEAPSASPEPVKAKEPEKAKEQPKEVEKPSEADYLEFEKFADRKMKAKIGGVEKEITVKDLVKGYQTDQYLTQKGQKIAEEFRQLQAVKASSESQKATAEKPADEPDDEFYRTYVKPYVSEQDKTINTLIQEINALKSVTGPIQYESNLKKVDKDMRDQGYDDFMAKVPDIQERILNMPVEQQMTYDTDWGFKMLYKDIKLNEMREMIKKPATPETIKVDVRPQPKLVNVESGAGSPSGADDSRSQIDSMFRKATETGKTQDWAQVIQMKYGA